MLARACHPPAIGCVAVPAWSTLIPVARHLWPSHGACCFRSLGEQQRIGMARMFFHKPTVGIMDECTSAVSVDAEEQLYQSAHDAGITAVTVSQRLGLERFHSQELRFGCDNVHGWTIHEIAEPAGHEISDASGEVGPSLVGWHKARTN